MIAAICLLLAHAALAQNYPLTTNITYAQAFASLKTNRDRLLTSYAQRRGYQNAVQVWAAMSPSQKGVFLTTTDYLGRRSYLHFNNNYEIRYVGDQIDRAYGCASRNEGGSGYYDYFWVHPENYPDSCRLVPASTCVGMGKCQRITLPRTDHDMILSHVSLLYAVNGSNGSDCGGEQNNRIYFKADDELIFLLRNIDYGLPTWYKSTDLGGPHEPFTQSREGTEGQPRGQTHQWAWDYEARTLNRPGVSGIFDPHIVEMDIDYNFWHDSNPECRYDNTYGRTFYQNYWSTRGLGGSAELDYFPTNAPVITERAAVTADFDGDGKSDESVFRSSDAVWYQNRSQQGFAADQFGAANDLIVPADYDGDDKIDRAVFRPQTAEWLIINSSTGAFVGAPFGAVGDVPTPGDYDGDGRADLAVWRPSTGVWFVRNSGDGATVDQQFGLNGDVPQIADFDADDKNDFAIYRPSTGVWSWINSSNQQITEIGFGAPGDVAATGDFDRDGKADVSVFRPSTGTWHRINSGDNQQSSVQFGMSGDVPAIGDYDGDGKADICVWRASDGYWYRLNSSDNSFAAVPFGMNGDKPVPAAFQP